MEIDKIIYETTRGVLNVEDKLRIATVFLFCRELGSKKFSELLYAENHVQFIETLNSEYRDYGVDFTVNFKNPNVKNAFYKTLEKVIEEEDSDGFLKAISEGGEYALVICEIVNYQFDIPDCMKIKKEMAFQLSFWD